MARTVLPPGVEPSAYPTVELEDDQGGITAETDHRGDVVFQIPTIDVRVAGQEVRPTKAVIDTDRYTAAARAEIEGLWEGSGGYPPRDEKMTVDINDVRVFTGKVYESGPQEGDGVKVVGMDAVKKLIQTKIDLNMNHAFLTNMVDEAMKLVSGVDYEYDFPRFPRGGADWTQRSVASILGIIARWGNVIWWVNEYNKLKIMRPEPELHIFGPHYIGAGPNATKEEPPYQKVIVYGESPASSSAFGHTAGGYGTGHVMAKDRVQAEAGSGKPVYTHESTQIQTKTQAKAAAEAILNEFYKQRARGSVTIIGEGAPVNPIDIIRMPPELDEEEYLAASIKHTFSSQEGYITDIQCGGVPRAQS
jgi:hypothetical protein